MFSVRTDLAEEAVNLHCSTNRDGIVQCEYHITPSVRAVRVEITTAEAARQVGKPCGVYTTIFLSSFNEHPAENEEEISGISAEISSLLPQGLILVVGLGNRNITPDAFGPLTAERIIATRHLSENLKNTTGLEAWCLICHFISLFVLR